MCRFLGAADSRSSLGCDRYKLAGRFPLDHLPGGERERTDQKEHSKTV